MKQIVATQYVCNEMKYLVLLNHLAAFGVLNYFTFFKIQGEMKVKLSLH